MPRRHPKVLQPCWRVLELWSCSRRLRVFAAEKEVHPSCCWAGHRLGVVATLPKGGAALSMTLEFCWDVSVAPSKVEDSRSLACCLGVHPAPSRALLNSCLALLAACCLRVTKVSPLHRRPAERSRCRWDPSRTQVSPPCFPVLHYREGLHHADLPQPCAAALPSHPREVCCQHLAKVPGLLLWYQSFCPLKPLEL